MSRALQNVDFIQTCISVDIVYHNVLYDISLDRKVTCINGQLLYSGRSEYSIDPPYRVQHRWVFTSRNCIWLLVTNGSFEVTDVIPEPI